MLCGIPAARGRRARRDDGRNCIGVGPFNSLVPGGRPPYLIRPIGPGLPQKAGVSPFARAVRAAATVSAMRDDKLEVSVSFEEKRGYFTTGSELPQSLTALSLGGLRRRIEVALLPDEPVVQLRLDRVARLERDRRRRA